ncbi:ABC transporter substrate-binding protein [Phyllobacterium sp. TAF24]|jgi:ribose transport system substrate-binding protein|uniref:ABC transporter substrate-binding protein n=1 Tax=unclassified Phyllobacterium TaxID=2638441 RepID=UPI0008923A8B|nr:ABC transporter substrate-binding protein [Phyllobacterium sp. OV277]SDP27752.1 monosaccharide ABC transporter substrate-binding protein, CUT2 family [Phyllobacterium sp. OV277]
MLRSFIKAASVAAILIGGSQAVAFAQSKPLKIGMTFQELNNPYFVSMQDALNAAAKSLGAEVVVTDARHDVAKQIADVEDMIQQGINILLVNPTDSSGIEAAVQAAHDAGIIVVAVDANASGPVDSFVGSKNRDAGYMSCKYLAQALGGSGEVAILDGIPVVPILQRVEGCKAALGEVPGIKIVEVQNGKQERDTALSVTENMIQAHPNLKGIFSVNDGGSMGVLSAIEASGKDIKLTSVDGAPEAVEAIGKGGAFIETTAQFPRDQVRIGLALALAKHWGAKVVPQALPIDVVVVDAKNASGFSW